MALSDPTPSSSKILNPAGCGSDADGRSPGVAAEQDTHGLRAVPVDVLG
jgi:hypothetical protein